LISDKYSHWRAADGDMDITWLRGQRQNNIDPRKLTGRRTPKEPILFPKQARKYLGFALPMGFKLRMLAKVLEETGGFDVRSGFRLIT
jgi:hypothetical protein